MTPPLVQLRNIVRDRFFHDVMITAFVYSLVRFVLFPAKWLEPAFALSEEAYRLPFILWGGLESPVGIGFFLFGALLLALNFIPGDWNPVRGRITYGDELPPKTNWFLFIVAIPLAWKMSTYDINLFLDQAHIADRLLLVVLWLGILKNPAFVPMFIAHMAMIAGQFAVPEGCMHYTWADKIMPTNMLLIFWVTFLVSRIRRLSVWVFPFLVICHVGSLYFYPMVGKFIAGESVFVWIAHNPLQDLFVGAHLNGWLSGLSEPQAMRVAALIQTLRVPIQLFVALLELAPLVMIWRRKTTVLMIAAAVSMHLGIFASSGIFFWEWIIPDLTLIAFLIGPWGRNEMGDLFRSPTRWIAAPMVLFALPIFWPYILGWLDTPYNVVYHLEVEDEAGNSVELAREFMDPYELPFTQSRFHFADPRVTVPVSSYGSIGDVAIWRRMLEIETPDQMAALNAELGTSRFEQERQDEFVRWAEAVFSNYNARGGRKSVVPSFMEAPHHQLSTSGVHLQPGGESIRRVRLIVRDTFFDGEALHPMDEQVIVEVEIPAVPGDAE